MKIFLCYGYDPNTSAVYFERALRREHEVYHLGPPSGSRTGYAQNQDISKYNDLGLPQPDLVLLMDPSGRFFPRGLEKLACPTAVYLIDVHQNLPYRLAHAPFFDYVFVAQKDYLEYFRHAGIRQVFWLPLACDPEIHCAPRMSPRWDIGFVGNARSPIRARRLALLAGHFSSSDYQRHYGKEEIASVYAQSRVVFNSSVNGDLNMRVFEAMASGTMLITDRIANGQDELFEDRVHFVTYSDDQELLEGTNYYLDHESEREGIAREGKSLVLSKHTYEHRCQYLLNTIFSSSNPTLAATVRHVEEFRRRVLYSHMYYQLGLIDPIVEEFAIARGNRWGSAQVMRQLLGCFTRAIWRAIH